MQRRADGAAPAADADGVHAAAATGISGSAGRLPHFDAIQRSFGRHDVSGIAAHTDGAAARGAQAMGAEAFATGDHVAFAGAPSLHTAAHEAAHVVQQRAGVHLKGGVGEVGDAHEQHADAVADLVVRGESAEGLLDHYAGAGAAAASPVQQLVQRKVGLEFETAAAVRTKGNKEVAYGTRLFDGAGWHVEADSSSLEFVTDPFSTWAGLSKAVAGAAGLATTIEKKSAEMAPKRPVLNGKWLIGNGSAVSCDCAPQATGGVPLNKIPDMFNAVGKTKLDHLEKDDEDDKRSEDTSLMGYGDAELPPLAAAEAKAVVDAIKKELETDSKTVPSHGFGKLEGLIALILQYVQMGAQQTTVWSYSKIIAPIMSRVNFTALFASLEHDEKPYLTADRLMKPSGLDGAGAMFAKGYGEDEDVYFGPSRKDWIDSIREGTGPDMMSYNGGTRVAGGDDKDHPSSSGSSSGLGAMTKMDKSVDGVPLAVLELRRMPQWGDPPEWLSMAKNVYDFFATFDPSLKEKPVLPSIEVPSVTIT
ncbi:MAG TPA: DUF4157 domain-containing protein, partial [Kofleriaceae bacterium]|nr:DUF4157 domain-containing protein [Kofleriaceae bacterium]